MLATYSKLVLFLLFISLFSCKKDETALLLRFQLQYEGQPLVMLNDYTYPDGKKIQFTRVSFFISELVAMDGTESVQIKDVDFLNLSQSHGDVQGASEGFIFIDQNVPLESIDQLTFNIGLTEDQNRTVPADYSSGQPLARPGEYWIAWDSYIFAKIEGWIDLDEDGEVETGIALHMGSDNVFRSKRIDVDQPANDLALVIDLAEVFFQDKMYDISANPQLHSLSQLAAAEELADNLIQTIQLKK